MNQQMRDQIYQYQNEICYFNKMLILSNNPEEKGYFWNLINGRTEELIHYIDHLINSAKTIDNSVGYYPLDKNRSKSQGITDYMSSIESDPREANEQMSNNSNMLREFSIEELSNYDGSNGKDAYVAVEGIVYDVTNVPAWENGEHFTGLKAGMDLTTFFMECHGGLQSILNMLPKVGVLSE